MALLPPILPDISSVRPPVRLAGVLAAVVLSGCPAPSPADGEDDGTDDGPGEPQACADSGSPLLDNTKPAPLPGDNPAAFSCTSGWGTDAPQLDATWTLELPVTPSVEFGFISVAVAAHPQGGAVVVGSGLFARYGADGEQLWSVDQAIPAEAEVVLAVDDTGTTVLSYYDWVTESGGANRYDADGGLNGPVAIPWNSPDYSEVWGLVPFADELIVGAVDIDSEGSYETTLMRLDASDALLLRKSTNMTNGGLLAVNDGSTIVFGRFPTFLLARDNGAVRGMLTPSQGGITGVAGFGNDFVTTGSASGDLTVARYSEFGVERWLQTYDRATLSDNGRAIAAGPDSMVVAGTTSVLDFSDTYWFGTQPHVLGVDADGNAIWSDRIDAVGEANGVAYGSVGEVYVIGLAEGVDNAPTGEPTQIAWLRRYDP